MFLLAFCIILFWIAPYGNTLLIILILALSGFLVYGPLMLVSVAAATYAGKKSAASASGFTGFWGYVGATISGVGVGGVAEYYGWKGAFMMILFSAFLSAVFFALACHALCGGGKGLKAIYNLRKRKFLSAYCLKMELPFLENIGKGCCGRGH